MLSILLIIIANILVNIFQKMNTFMIEATDNIPIS